MTDKTDALVALEETRHVRVLRDILGGVPADELHADQRRALDAAIEALAVQPAASVDVGWVEFLEEWIGDGCLGTFEHREKFRKAARALIDSAGEAKGPFGELMALYSERERKATPQPDGGDGAVVAEDLRAMSALAGEAAMAYYYQHPDGRKRGPYMLPNTGGGNLEACGYEQVLLYTRPSAAAAVDDAMVERALDSWFGIRDIWAGGERAAGNLADMRAALTAALDTPRAEQESE